MGIKPKKKSQLNSDFGIYKKIPVFLQPSTENDCQGKVSSFPTLNRFGEKRIIMDDRKAGTTNLLHKSFNSIKTRSIRWAVSCIGLGFLFLVVLTFTFPALAPFSILLMLAGVVTGIASSFTSSGKALAAIRKASKCTSANDYKQALNHLETAYNLKPTNAIKEQIEELKFYLMTHQKRK